MHDVNSAIYLQPALLNGTDQAKCIYIALWLNDGAPKTWLKAMLQCNNRFYNNWDAFCAAFCQCFQDLDLEACKLCKLEKLTQTSSAASYANEFIEGLKYVDWTEKHTICQFNHGLKHKLWLQLLKEVLPGMLDAWIPVIVHLDDRMHDLEVKMCHHDKAKSSSHRGLGSSCPHEKTSKSHSSNTGGGSHNPTPSDPSLSGDMLMEIDGVKHGKLTDAEHVHCKGLGLCFYCGQGKYHISECPNLSDNKKKKFSPPAKPSQMGKA